MPSDTSIGELCVAAASPEARAQRYHLAKMSHAEQFLLLQMLKFVGCDEGDAVYLALVEHMQRAERCRARARTRANRARRNGGGQPEGSESAWPAT